MPTMPAHPEAVVADPAAQQRRGGEGVSAASRGRRRAAAQRQRWEQAQAGATGCRRDELEHVAVAEVGVQPHPSMGVAVPVDVRGGAGAGEGRPSTVPAIVVVGVGTTCAAGNACRCHAQRGNVQSGSVLVLPLQVPASAARGSRRACCSSSPRRRCGTTRLRQLVAPATDRTSRRTGRRRAERSPAIRAHKRRRRSSAPRPRGAARDLRRSRHRSRSDSGPQAVPVGRANAAGPRARVRRLAPGDAISIRQRLTIPGCVRQCARADDGRAAGAQHGVTGRDADHLHRLVGDWQLLADLSFADLLLFVPVERRQLRDASRRCVRRPGRPRTRTTSSARGRARRSDRSCRSRSREGRICREGDPVWVAGRADPRGGHPGQPRRPGDRRRRPRHQPGRGPHAQPAGDRLSAQRQRPGPDARRRDAGPSRATTRTPTPGLRVGDGLVRLDADGTVSFASPNALSAYRRLGHPGDLDGAAPRRGHGARSCRRTTTAGRPAGRAPSRAAGSPGSGEVETPRRDRRLRAIPLRPGGEHIGALVLVHDVTELRRRERQLVGKDATIREIHHRVKNNLQTVAALLRLQARRMGVPEARAALEESVRRVSSIAVVHETLSGDARRDGGLRRDRRPASRRWCSTCAGRAVRLRRDGARSVCCPRRSRRRWRWS